MSRKRDEEFSGGLADCAMLITLQESEVEHTTSLRGFKRRTEANAWP